jgi:hypothetical protein
VGRRNSGNLQIVGDLRRAPRRLGEAHVVAMHEYKHLALGSLGHPALRFRNEVARIQRLKPQERNVLFRIGTKLKFPPVRRFDFTHFVALGNADLAQAKGKLARAAVAAEKLIGFFQP